MYLFTNEKMVTLEIGDNDADGHGYGLRVDGLLCE